MTVIAPVDPRANYFAHQHEVDTAIRRVLDSGWYVLGEEVEAFEREFANYIGGDVAVIGVGSGTEALHLALRALGCHSNDRVITVSHTAVATVAAIELSSACPVLVDVDPVSYTMDPNLLEDTIKQSLQRGEAIKAIVPVHLYGHPADMPAIMDIADRFGLTVIEDCAQSHGASLKGIRTGRWGHMAAFSFYPTKNLGGLGDAGAVVTTQKELAVRVRRLREYGWGEQRISELRGTNSRLDEIQAAVLRAKLPCLDHENELRRNCANRYRDRLISTSLRLPITHGDVTHVFHQYVVRTIRRDALREFLRSQEIDTLIHYPVPVHLQPAYRSRVLLGCGSLETTERLSQEVLSLPMHPQLTEDDIHRVHSAIFRWHAESGGLC